MATICHKDGLLPRNWDWKPLCNQSIKQASKVGNLERPFSLQQDWVEGDLQSAWPDTAMWSRTDKQSAAEQILAECSRNRG